MFDSIEVSHLHGTQKRKALTMFNRQELDFIYEAFDNEYWRLINWLARTGERDQWPLCPWDDDAPTDEDRAKILGVPVIVVRLTMDRISVLVEICNKIKAGSDE